MCVFCVCARLCVLVGPWPSSRWTRTQKVNSIWSRFYGRLSSFSLAVHEFVHDSVCVSVCQTSRRGIETDVLDVTAFFVGGAVEKNKKEK